MNRLFVPATGRASTVVLMVAALAQLAIVAGAHGAESLPPDSLPLFSGGTLELRSLIGRVAVIRFAASW